ncbi:MAG: OmpA family protein [Acidobacteria bacterium]|nr:MAG: OmpA family protein [Acidobacteriota bacterium]
MVVRLAAAAAGAALLASCASLEGAGERLTRRDKTAKGAGIGAASGAAAAILLGKRKADEILLGAAIGAGIGAGIGSYMDAQEERLAQIPGTTVERVEDDVLLVRFDSDLLFDFDSAALSESALNILDEVAAVLREFDKTAVVIQGHTDATGSEEYNQRLSERRAEAVRNQLITLGIDPARTVAVGYGERHPVAPNDTPEGRRLNRRVTILLKAKAR